MTIKHTTQKFGKSWYVLIWDSATFGTYDDPNSRRSIAEKKGVAKLWSDDYIARDYRTKITSYRSGKDFKVWGLPM